MSKKIAVMSNKGGVGKTTIAINIAWELKRHNKRVALLDIDFHGPTLPVMLSINERPQVTAYGIKPVIKDGVQIMSLHFLLRQEDDPCLWSGETKRMMVEQFLEKSVLWEEYDYMIIDCPPSLGDENIVIATKVDKIVLVTTPHPASVYDIKKMLRVLRDKVCAIVVNMCDVFSGDLEAIKKLYDRIYLVPFDRELQSNPTKEVESIKKLVEEVILV